MRTVRETCTRCPNKLVNPTWQTKYCPVCKKVVQAEQSAKKNAEISEASRIRRIANGTEKSKINPFFLRRGEISMSGDKPDG